jgi:hypothetical protein
MRKHFAPTAKLITIRMLLALATQFGWKVHQMDIKSAFLNGDLQEEVYMEQPEGFAVEGKEKLVCKLVKALYGLKQAPRAWYEKINKYLKSRSFKRSDYDPNLYIKEKGEEIIIMVVYVDDLIITGSSDDLIQEEKDSLCKSFDMTDLGLLHYCLGIEVWQQPNRIFISQTKYASKLLEKFRMEDCNPSKTPMEVNLKLSKDDESEVVNELFIVNL